jgi:hypothetical protein
MRVKPTWLLRRCQIGNDFPIVLHVEGQPREQEREKIARLRVSSPDASARVVRALRAADLHQRCIGPCSCFSSLLSVSLLSPCCLPGVALVSPWCRPGVSARSFMTWPRHDGCAGGGVDTRDAFAREADTQDRGRQKILCPNFSIPVRAGRRFHRNDQERGTHRLWTMTRRMA